MKLVVQVKLSKRDAALVLAVSATLLAYLAPPEVFARLVAAINAYLSH